MVSWYLSIFGGFEKFSKNNSGKIWRGQKKVVPLHSLSEKNEGAKSSFCESAKERVLWQDLHKQEVVVQEASERSLG